MFKVYGLNQVGYFRKKKMTIEAKPLFLLFLMLIDCSLQVSVLDGFIECLISAAGSRVVHTKKRNDNRRKENKHDGVMLWLIK